VATGPSSARLKPNTDINSMSQIPLILVINLKRDVQRWNGIQGRLQSLGMPAVRIRAIDARRKFSLVRAKLPGKYFSISLLREMTAGEVCCTLSHVAALKRFLRTGEECAIVLEDDVILGESFANFIHTDLRPYLSACDIVKFEGIPYFLGSKTGPILRQGQYSTLIMPFKPSLGSAAYAVTRSGAKRLLSRFVTLADPVDYMIFHFEDYLFPIGETRPLVLLQGDYGSNVAPDRDALMMSMPKPGLAKKLEHAISRGVWRRLVKSVVFCSFLLWRGAFRRGP
jgi:glycosyl transferase, family 25